jgi:hypothetical protein
VGFALAPVLYRGLKCCIGRNLSVAYRSYQYFPENQGKADGERPAASAGKANVIRVVFHLK